MPEGRVHPDATGHQEPSANPNLSVIVVSYNTREMTLDCLRALDADVRSLRLSAEVFVVDNASRDGSPAAIRAAFPGVRVIENSTNAGFGAANNLAMNVARGRHLLLLNSDAFVRPGAVANLVAYLDGHADVGVVGPRLLNADGSLQVSCFPFPSPARAWLENLWLPKLFPRHEQIADYRRWPHDVERRVDWVVGACMLVRREVYQQVGGFDERFFMYAEETDWQQRIRSAGWGIAFTPASEVTHLGGASGSAESAKISRSFFVSLDRYELKHHGLGGLVLLRMAMLAGALLRLPGWLAVYACRPARRRPAGAKLRLLSWLLVRQATDWRVGT